MSIDGTATGMSVANFLVLDLETKPDPVATALAPSGGSRTRPGLQQITAVALLQASEDADGTWRQMQLYTFGAPDDEFEVLMHLDEHLAGIAGRTPVVVTFNGIRHDLGIIRRRAARHWMFGLPGLQALAGMEHRDVMVTMTRGWRDTWPSLRDACAGFGIPTDPLAGKGRDGDERSIRKCRIDVVATFVLLLYELAIARGTKEVLINGWSALNDALRELGDVPAYLEQFRHDPMLAAALRRNANKEAP